MQNCKQNKSLQSIIIYVTAIMAVAIQIQVTLFAKGDYLGLRINLADLLLPVIGLYVVVSLFTKKSFWPKWSVNGMWFWLGALITLMTAALINGYVVNGSISSWALINKYIGFFILLSYALLGGWLMTNAKEQNSVISKFTKTFSIFFIAITALSAILIFIQHNISYPLWLSDYAWDGLMANRNAFMFIMVMTFIFTIWSYAQKTNIALPKWLQASFWMILPIFFIYNDSRTGWILAALLAVVLFIRNPALKLKKVIPFFIVGVVIAYSSYGEATHKVVMEGRQMQFLVQAVSGKNNVQYMGDQKRYIAIEDALEMYQAHDPMVGAGLGSYKPFQIEKRGEFIEVIDFTALWVFSEMGLLGIAIFIAFFTACGGALYKTGFGHNGSAFHRAMLTCLFAFALMSVLHELMYTRALWFAMGLALAYYYTNPKKA